MTIARAERLVWAGLQALRWTEKELPQRPKGDKGKVNLAWPLRAETTTTPGWVAQRLSLGSWTYVSNLLRENPKCHFVSIMMGHLPLPGLRRCPVGVNVENQRYASFHIYVKD